MSYPVKEYMTTEVNTIDADATVMAAANIMAADPDFEGYVIVLQKGKPFSMVTEHDLVNKVIAGRWDPATTPVADVMSTPLVTIDPDDDLMQASQAMKERNVRKLVVIRDEIICGVITDKHLSYNVQEYVDRSIRNIIRWTASLGI